MPAKLSNVPHLVSISQVCKSLFQGQQTYGIEKNIFGMVLTIFHFLNHDIMTKYMNLNKLVENGRALIAANWIPS